MISNNRKVLSDSLLLGLHKPKGTICSHKDEKGRLSIYDLVPKKLTKHTSGILHSVGRLDFNTQGLILLTNNTKIKHYLESPSSKIMRIYKVRIQGILKDHQIDIIKKGIVIKGVKYNVLDIVLTKKTRSYTWLIMKLNHGKNQHIRKIFLKLGYTVNKLIRIQYGPYKLASLEVGHIRHLNLNKIRL